MEQRKVKDRRKGPVREAEKRECERLREAVAIAERFTRIMDNSFDEIYIFDSVTLHIIHVSVGACKNLGYTGDELLKLTALDLEPEYTRDKFEALAKPLRSGEKPSVFFETVHKRKDGTLYPVEAHLQLPPTETPPFFLAIIQDISERKQTEKILREAYDQLEARIRERTAELMAANEQLRKLSRAAEQSPSSIIITDTAARIEYVNPKFTLLSGHTLEDVIGKNPRILKSGKTTHEEYKVLWETITSGKEWRGEFQNRKKNGDCYWGLASISPIKDAQGKTTHFISTMEDITERKLAEEKLDHTYRQLLHAEKLSSTGKLVVSLAHEFNNPLFGITNVLEQVREDCDLDEEHRALVQLAIKECNRIARLVRNLHDFHRTLTGKRAPLDIHEVIDDMVLLCQKKLQSRNIALEKRYAGNLPKIHAISDQISQVILNLLQNAEEAITGEGGKITISTEKQEDRIKVRFHDTGCGIPPEQMKLVFDPFYTTKSELKGTGLGLSVSYGIMQAHGGNIEVESRPNEGSTFTLFFPADRDIA